MARGSVACEQVISAFARFDPSNSGFLPRGFLREAFLAIGVAEEVADAALSTCAVTRCNFVNYVKFITLVWRSSGASGAVVGSIPSREDPAPAWDVPGWSPTSRDGFNVIDELATQALEEVSPEASEEIRQLMLQCLKDPSAYVRTAVETVKRAAPVLTASASPTGRLEASARGVAGAIDFRPLQELNLEAEGAVLQTMVLGRQNPSAYIMTAVETLKSGMSFGGVVTGGAVAGG